MSTQPEYFAFYADGEIKKFSDIESALASDCLFAMEQIRGQSHNYGYTNTHYTFNFHDQNGGSNTEILIGKWKLTNIKTSANGFFQGLDLAIDIVDPEGVLRKKYFGKTDESFASSFRETTKYNFLNYILRLKKLYNWDQFDLAEENRTLRVKIKNLEAEKEKLEAKLKALETKE